MICPRCRRINGDDTPRCECGFAYIVAPEELEGWFGEVRQTLENAYLAAPTPWQQSGKRGTFENWARLRIPIAECVDRSGTFLDIGCANGLLLECLLDWTLRKGISIEPFGLDFSERIAGLARQRLPQFARNIFTGNAWAWLPPARDGKSQTFDYVRTEVVYVPRNLQRAYLSLLLADVVAPGGYLLVGPLPQPQRKYLARLAGRRAESVGFCRGARNTRLQRRRARIDAGRRHREALRPQGF